MKKNRAVAAIVNYKDMILLGKKRDGKGFLSGKWHIPGETLEEKESDESGLIRGIKEEAGIQIKVLRYLASHQTPKHTLLKWYECKALTYDIKAGSDLDEVKWVSRGEIFETCDDKATSIWPKEIREYFSSPC